VLTPGSPAGKAIVGKEVGDEYELLVAGKARLWEIEEVG
jgi:transcription elongation GreA/GreB family factor